MSSDEIPLQKAMAIPLKAVARASPLDTTLLKIDRLFNGSLYRKGKRMLP